MLAFKFLASGSVGLFSGYLWPVPERGEEGAWVGVDGNVEACATGVHACRLGVGLLDWIDDELWRIELEDAVDVADDVVLAARGRLVSRIDAWDADAARAFASACKRRASELASPEFAADAASLLTGGRPETGAMPSADGPPTPGAIAANVAFVVAHAVAMAGTEAYEDGYLAERRWQLEWLADHLNLVPAEV
jgi:hypothetical protein